MRKPIMPAPVLAPASALVWWVVGYLPWLLSGMGDDIGGRYVASSRIAIPLLAPRSKPVYPPGRPIGSASR